MQNLNIRSNCSAILRNLDAFQDGNNDILSHNLKLDSSRTIEVDDIAIPTGKFLDVTGTPSDFRKGEELGARWNETVGLCGSGTVIFHIVSPPH